MAPSSKSSSDDNEKRFEPESLSAYVSNVHFDGIKHTSAALLTKQARQLFLKVNSFQDLVDQTNVVRERLEELNIFKSVSCFIDVDRKKGESHAYDVTYHVEEKSRLNLNITTMASLENRPSVVLRGSLLNLGGGAEHIDANIHCGTNWDIERFLTVTAPLMDAPHIKASVGVSDVASDLSWLRLMDRTSAVFFGVNWPTFAGQHSMRMECAWRELLPGKEFTRSSIPLSIRSECGHYLRCAFRHMFERDVRDNPILPTRGWMARVTQVFATGGGGYQQTHIQHEMEGQWCVPLRENVKTGSCISAQLSVGCGLIRSLAGGGRISVVDRFFLGGPLHLRGFKLRQVGDHTEDGSCPIGALAYIQSGAHLYSTLPWIGGRGFMRNFRLHAFTIGACLSDREPMWMWNDWWNIRAMLTRETRLSAGLGVACQLAGIARFEVNYCFPLLARASDRSESGLQFGIGFNFL